MSSAKLSVVIITKNEARNIARCLDTAIPVADEILVVDSFSTDNTIEICTQYKIRFVQTQWQGYAQTKNYANSLAQYDWILSLDADEVLDKSLQDSILAEKSNSFPVEGYSIRRLPYYCGKPIYYSNWNPDVKVRLFNRTKAQWQGAFIHETIVFSKPLKPALLSGLCHHFTMHSIEDHLNTINRFTTLQALERIKQNQKTTWIDFTIKPLFEFFKSYWIKKGFLDGRYGLIISMMNAYSRFLRAAKVYQLRNSSTPK